jgi:hypothetical protein
MQGVQHGARIELRQSSADQNICPMPKESETISATDVLAYWRAVELFSPQGVPNLGKDRVRDVGDAVLPWDDERAKKGLGPSQTLQHDVFVGVFSLDKAYAQMRDALSYPDEGENGDLPQAGESALAAFTVADDGRVIIDSQILSSCAWAIGRACLDGAGSLRWLEGFEHAAGEFRKSFEQLMNKRDDADSQESVAHEDERVGPVLDSILLEEICEYVRGSQVADGSRCVVAVRDAVGVRVRSRPVGTVNRYRAMERNFLNSFIARDLDTVAQAVGEEAVGQLLTEISQRIHAGRRSSQWSPLRLQSQTHKVDHVWVGITHIDPPPTWP